jgi:hypothetical protein
MVKCGVFFAVRTEFFNIILMGFGFEGLRTYGLYLEVKMEAVCSSEEVGNHLQDHTALQPRRPQLKSN